jgi:hypothetical protein
MKRFGLLLCASLLFGGELGTVRTVYLLPMGRGLDQYLANRLTNEGVFQVVTNPKSADAFFTERIGEGFEAQVANLVPAPPAPTPSVAEPAAAEKNGKKAKDEAPKAPPINETANKLENPAMNSSFGRGRGTIFLVDAKSHQVLWSAFEPAKGTAAREMDRTATDIVTRIKKDLGGKK